MIRTDVHGIDSHKNCFNCNFHLHVFLLSLKQNLYFLDDLQLEKVNFHQNPCRSFQGRTIYARTQNLYTWAKCIS